MKDDFFDKWLMKIVTGLTVLSILFSLLFIVAIIWYAFTGDPAADIGHFIKTIRESAK